MWFALLLLVRYLSEVCAKYLCIISDGSYFIPSLWNGSYVCSNNINITYLLNVTKAENGIDTIGHLFIDNHSLDMTGTFASFAKILALQSHDLVTDKIFGIDFTDVEINMLYHSSLFMEGAIVFKDDNSNNSTKSCRSELRRIAGRFLNFVFIII